MLNKNLDDFYEFKKFHKNKYNRFIHIISFLVGFTSFCFLINQNSRYLLLFIYLFLIFISYNITIFINIVIILGSIFFLFYYFKIHSKPLLFIIVIITYIIPEISHIYFNEKTYLYNRLHKEKGFVNGIIQLIKHCINLVPYCMM